MLCGRSNHSRCLTDPLAAQLNARRQREETAHMRERVIKSCCVRASVLLRMCFAVRARACTIRVSCTTYCQSHIIIYPDFALSQKAADLLHISIYTGAVVGRTASVLPGLCGSEDVELSRDRYRCADCMQHGMRRMILAQCESERSDATVWRGVKRCVFGL